MSDQIQSYAAVSAAMNESSQGVKAFVPPKNNAPDSANHLGVYYLGDARPRPPSSGEPWTEDEYRRLVKLTHMNPVNKPHRWKEISYALAINPSPDDVEKRDQKREQQEKLKELNEKKKDPKDVKLEDVYYCHGCGNPNSLTSTSCVDCATPNVQRSPEECFMQLPILYYKFKDKVLVIDDEVITKQRIGPLFLNYHPNRMKEISQKERADRRLYSEEYVYGEWDIQNFEKMFQRVKRIFGHLPPDQTGVFWDLGCGCGKLVVMAGCMHSFTQCWGIEFIRSLSDEGERMVKELRDMEQYKKENERFRDIMFRVVCSDFLESDAWVDNTTMAVLHSTCLNNSTMEKIVEKAASMNIGCLLITVTKPLPDEKRWFRIGEDEVEMTWGKAKIFFHEKISM